jgi:DNA-binding CsgD family transcriptional regulator
MTGRLASRPIIVIDGGDESYSTAVAAARLQGWALTEGFKTAGPARPGGIRHGIVRTAEDAAGAVLAALDGEGLMVLMRAPAEVVDRLLDDLRHLGPVELRRTVQGSSPAVADDGLAILGLLAAGRSLGEAATQLGLSRRTADRRLAEARRALGAQRTAEAVARARRLGWLS